MEVTCRLSFYLITMFRGGGGGAYCYGRKVIIREVGGLRQCKLVEGLLE